MARDLLSDEYGDLVIDPDTHDLAIVDGVDEIAQRIRTTLDIRHGEMVNLDPEMGADYQNFLGKNFDPDSASNDMVAAITANVPEVESVDNIEFIKGKQRHLTVKFRATVTVEGEEVAQQIEGRYDIGN